MDIAGLEFTEEQALWRGGAPGEAGPEKGRSCGGRGPGRGVLLVIIKIFCKRESFAKHSGS